MLLRIRGYDQFTTADNSDLVASHTAVSASAAVSTVNPRTGTRCLELGAGTEFVRDNGDADNAFPNHTSHVLGFAFRFSNLGAGVVIAKILDGTTVQGALKMNASYELEVYRGDSAALLGTAAVQLQPATWYYIEWRYIIDATTGSTKVRINAVERIIVDNVNTKAGSNAYANGYSLHGSTLDYRFDDLYFLNGTTSSPGPANNNFLGDVKVVLLLPDGDGTTNAWTPNSGSNRYSRVNEVPSDGDSTFISTNNPGDVQLLTFSNLSNLTATVFGVQISAYVRKDASDARVVKLAVRPGSTGTPATSFSAGHSVTTSYTLPSWMLNYDPEASTGWSGATVNAAQAGIKLES